jgi:hypothetical protein
MNAKLPKVVSHACVRCSGDLFLDLDDAAYFCLQCGRATALAALTMRLAGAQPVHGNEIPERRPVAA